MSEYPNSEQLTHVVASLVTTVQDAHAQLVDGAHKLSGHNLAPDAHGLDNPQSPMRKNIEEIVINALDSGAIDERIDASVNGKVDEALDAALPEAVAEKLPELVASEFQKPDSPVRVTVANQVETIISDKIESGQIGGGSGGGNKPITPDKPVDPDPDQPDKPENPDEPQPAAVGKAEINSPLHGATGLDIPFSVSISEFAVTNDGTDTAKAVQLQVAKDSRFENIVFDTGQIAPTRQISVTSGVSFNEVVYIRARYIGNSLGEGPWSTFVGVTTRAVLIESDDFWDVMPDPTGECTITDFGAEPELTLSLNGGPMYEAPAIDGADIWRGGGTVFIRLAQAAGMAISSAVKYEVFVTGDETLREVEAGEGGFAQFSFVLDSKLADPAKKLVAAVAIDADGNRSAIARRVFRAVPKSHPLCADSLEEGTDFPAPIIECKSFWKRESRVTMTVAPAPDSAIPARYEAFAEGFGNIVSVNADEFGHAAIGITLPASVQGETKILVRVVPVASGGRHGKAANKVLNVVTNDITLVPKWLSPNENDPINRGNVVFQIEPFATLCGDVAEKQDGARYRILDESGVTVFDSGILTQAANFDRYGAYAPDLPDDPGLVYTLQARVRGASLGWGEWASRKVVISQVASPTMTKPVNGESFIWGGGIPCETSELALPAGGFDEHDYSDWKMSYDNLGLDVICEDLQSPDLTSHVIVPADVRDDANCFLFCRHRAQTAGLSAWSAPVMVKTTSGGVNKAVITGPAPDSVISVNDAGVTVTAGDFGTDGLADAHIASDWKICSDINGNSALVQALDSPDLLAHTFSVEACAALVNGTQYYLFTRQKGARLGWGPWSDPLAFTAKKAGVRAAQLTAPAANAVIVFNDTGITLATAAFSVDGATDSHESTDWKITSDVAGGNIALEAVASADKLSHLFTAAQCAALADGATLYAFARHKGQRFGYGPWSQPVVIKMKKGVVNTPSIISPTGNVITVNTLELVCSAFASTDSKDIHESTNWYLAKDAACTQIVKQKLNSPDKTRYVFNIPLTHNQTYYLFCEHNGKLFGKSAKSAGVPITILLGKTTSGGQKIYKLASNDGIMIEHTGKKGKEKFAVALACNHPNKAWLTSNTDIGLTNYTDLSGRVTAGMTDAQLNALGGYDAGTAKANTNALVSASSPAAQFCRSVKIGGVACDLPNMNQLRVIFALKDEIDALDHTVAANPNTALGSWNFGGASFAWSSTECSASGAWNVHSNGGCSNDYKTTQGGVIPVREM